MRFKDRKDAGEKLAGLLLNYNNDSNAIVLGLARGGVVTAAPIALKLKLPLDVICPRKIGVPLNPELAIGAVTESGDVYLDPGLIAFLNAEHSYTDQQVAKEQSMAIYRTALFRRGLPPLNLRKKNVILVDDGIATGATMLAAIHSVRGQGAAKIIVAVPVAPQDTYRKIADSVEQMVVLSTPCTFFGVGEFYDEFRQTEDREVLQLLNRPR